MQEKSIILTPNNRLSRYLQRQFGATHTEIRAWHTPNILPLNSWLKNCWHECPDSRVLLDKQQEKLLWHKIIRATLNGKSNGLAALAAKTHSLINTWQIKIVNEDYHETEDIIIFQRVRSEFLEYCRSNGLVTASELPPLIAPYIQNYNFTKITFAGFDEYNPQLKTLITTIKNSGCEVLELDPNNKQNSTQKLLGFDKPTQEIIASARWAKKIIKEHPDRSIGIIVPNLVTLRPIIQKIFTEIFSDNGCTTHYNEQNYINISAGILLNSIPIITLILKSLTTKVPSPTQLQKPSEWSQTFIELIQTFDWHGKIDLTDLESAAIQYLAKTIQKLATTDFILGKISYKHALQILHELINDTTIQPKLEAEDIPINIFGTFEATGINFDHLWVMGIDQENWPPPPQPNPFIPIKIQKKLSLPNSSAERELHFAQTLINRYKRSAEDVIFSYVKQVADHPVSPSALVADIPEAHIDTLELEQNLSFAQKIYSSKKIEILEKDKAPQLAKNELTHAGSRLLELQSLCPFRAFMEFRLATKEQQRTELGISKITRGILIHSVLEKIWTEIKTQQNLCILESNQLQKLIEKSIESSLNQALIPPPFYKLEKQCLTLLITKWLEIEKNRQPFQVISTEKSAQINLASLQIKLRIDRIDQLSNGDILLIDYKTGKNIPSIFDWFGDRLQAPQLPLYGLAIDAIQGFALAQINIESLNFKNIGINELAIGFNTIAPHKNNITFGELKDYWQDTLTKIADDFVAGNASPTPLSTQVCKQCDFKSVCRRA